MGIYGVYSYGGSSKTPMSDGHQSGSPAFLALLPSSYDAHRDHHKVEDVPIGLFA